MDELFSLLPALFIFLLIIKRISGMFENVVKKSKEMHDDEIIYEMMEETGQKVNYDQTSPPVYEQENEPENIAEDNEELKQATGSSVETEEVGSEDKSEKIEKEVKKEIAAGKERKDITKRENNIFPDHSLKQKDIVRGIIFKQILDEPRAKKPWKPLNK